ncbi:uncharacterized protein LOC106085378 [Stomoxys calcitrans]|uniref:uncharacterized protein LOC106085378 n=1 Tax=Stomoxys calcitrans TaxID=35570 RepID=UPI0027E29589|nr:uncharacterized protein LOC106085378 [Stomoxys calcitrans]
MSHTPSNTNHHHRSHSRKLSQLNSQLFRETAHSGLQSLIEDNVAEEDKIHRKGEKESAIFEIVPSLELFLPRLMFRIGIIAKSIKEKVLTILHHLIMCICHFFWIVNTKLAYVSEWKTDIRIASCRHRHWMAFSTSGDLTYFSRSVFDAIWLVFLAMLGIILTLYELVINIMLTLNRFVYLGLRASLLNIFIIF